MEAIIIRFKYKFLLGRVYNKENCVSLASEDYAPHEQNNQGKDNLEQLVAVTWKGVLIESEFLFY